MTEKQTENMSGLSDEPAKTSPETSGRAMRQHFSIRSSHSPRWHADIVFVIDCTGSMRPLLDQVKERALVFADELRCAMAEHERELHSLRVRIVGFRDCYADLEDPACPPFVESRFFSLPEEREDFTAFLNALEPVGGGFPPESALEALHLAFRSPWKQPEKGECRRQIVVLFTDAAANPLEDPRRARPEYGSRYPEGVPESLDGLEREFCDPAVFPHTGNGAVLEHRLVLFTPENELPWKQMMNWEAVLAEWIRPEDGLGDLEMDTIYSMLYASML